MAREERFGEVRCLRVDRVAVDARRVDTQRRKGDATRGGAVPDKDVVPDIARKVRQLGTRDARRTISCGPVDRPGRIRGTGNDRTGMSIRSRLLGQEGGGRGRRHRQHPAHARVAVRAAVVGEGGRERLRRCRPVPRPLARRSGNSGGAWPAASPSGGTQNSRKCASEVMPPAFAIIV